MGVRSFLDLDLVELNLAGFCVDRCNGLGVGAKQGTRIDKALPIQDLNIRFMRVAIEYEIYVQFLARPELGLMAVKDCKPLAAEFNRNGNRTRKCKSGALQERRRTIAGSVGVAPDERQGYAKQLCKNIDAAYVSAVDDMADAEPIELLSGLTGCEMVPVCVGHDANDQSQTLLNPGQGFVARS